MAVLSILFLLTLTHATTGLFWKRYVLNSNSLSWTEAREHCRNKYVDLVIIDTQSEYESFKISTRDHRSDDCWIGLNKNPGETKFTRWCDGTALGFTAWGSGRPDGPDTQHCVVTKYNEWNDKDCSDSMKSFCYSYTPEMIVVQEMKTWEEALLHCRMHYTDLISITTETGHFLVNNRSAEILTSTFWTGLRFMDGSWFWVNQDYLGTPTSLPSCPARPYQCGARNIRDGVWENRDCEEKMNFICYHYASI